MTDPLTSGRELVSAGRRAVLRDEWEANLNVGQWWGIIHAHDVIGLLNTADEVDRLRAQVAAVQAVAITTHCEDPVDGLDCLHNGVDPEWRCLPCRVDAALASGDEVQSGG